MAEPGKTDTRVPGVIYVGFNDDNDDDTGTGCGAIAGVESENAIGDDEG